MASQILRTQTIVDQSLVEVDSSLKDHSASVSPLHEPLIIYPECFKLTDNGGILNTKNPPLLSYEKDALKGSRRLLEFESEGEVLPLGGWGIKDGRVDRDSVACSIQKASWKNRSMMTRFQMKWGSLVWTTCFCDM